MFYNKRQEEIKERFEKEKERMMNERKKNEEINFKIAGVALLAAIPATVGLITFLNDFMK